MYPCPYCDAQVADFALVCPACEEDLRPMARMNELPDVQYNQALQAARASDWPTAINLLGAVLVSRPGDVGAWVLLGSIHAQRGTLALARDCWMMAQLLDRKDVGSARGLKTLEAMHKSALAQTAGS
jgi:hypothetical protein